MSGIPVEIKLFLGIWRGAGYFLYYGYGGGVMKLRGLRGIPLIVAISASVILACISVLLMAGEYHSARFNLETYDREYQGWQAFRQMKPAYYEDNKEAVGACLTSLDAARDNFWVKRSMRELVGLFILAGLGSAAGGFLAIWGLILLIGMGFHKLGRWLSLRSGPKPGRPLECEPPLQSSISAECR